MTVMYRNRVVGVLAELEDGRIAFQYDTSWVADGFSISPFTLPLTERVYIPKNNDLMGLFGVFRDSLPDGFGSLIVRRRLLALGIGYDSLSPLSKLSLVGDSGLGALRYVPTWDVPSRQENIELDHMASSIRHILDETIEDGLLDQWLLWGGSSGGARPKAHVSRQDVDWIIKFPRSTDRPDVGKREYMVNQLAESVGIAVNEHALFPSSVCEGFFGAKRFDRSVDGRVHMISLSSLLETSHTIPNLDYVHLFQVIQRISVDQRDMEEAFRRMCFNVFLPNRDDHGKNHAFLYDEAKRGYRLSPAFDLTHTPDQWEHEMTVMGNGTPGEADLMVLAAEMKLPKESCHRILAAVKHAIQHQTW